MREDKLNDMTYWAENRPERPALKPLMVDETQDTSLDEEGFKLIPCYCGEFDSDLSVHSSEIELTSGVRLRECHCSQDKQKPFMEAVFTGNTELLEICIDQSTNFNVTDAYGDTAMHIVNDRGDIDMLKILLKMPNIDINVQNASGMTPLSVAVIAAHEESAKILLEHGADPNIADNHGKTPLSFSVSAGNTEVTQLLLEYGADVNVVDTFGNTPIATALLEKPVLNMVKVLLSSGANCVLQNNRLNPFLGRKR
ncbi:hypothetical protein HHI36_016035 [Cryptolaemus montrouzieri]|uniref:Uncharacterized protein n=1 Tax=Cryptolaemus montrouzieri TaxID=559131 RepID=A0ABD2N8H6_9CUCU